MHILIYGSRTFAPEENCLRTLKLTLTLTQTLTLTGVQFSSGAIVRIPLFTYYSMIKKFVNNIPYRKLSLTTFQNMKRTWPYLFYCKNMVKPYYIKDVHRVKRKHLFDDILQDTCSWKFTGKHPCSSHLLIKLQAWVHQKCFLMKCFS